MSKPKYKVFKNETFGRYMVADRDLKAGEVILNERATLVGPQPDGPPICLSCCGNLRTSSPSFCTGCHVAVLCRPDCKGTFHVAQECEALKGLHLDRRALYENHQIIYPLRCLLLEKYLPETWEKFLQLEAHIEQRRDTAIWRRHNVAVKRVLEELKVLPLKGDLIQKICGVLDVNTFEVRPPHSLTMNVNRPEVECLRGLYMDAALMAHDCTGNTFLSVDDDFVLKITASVDIPKDQPIFFNYANVLNGNEDRKHHLKEGKYFECSCSRCQDPTELGTEISSLKCHRCMRGKIRKHDPINWTCSDCKREFSGHLINTTVEEGRRRLQETDQTDVVQAEKLLETLTRTFSDNHFLVVELKQNLIGTYSGLVPSKKYLARKIALCKELRDVVSVIEPGISRIKAMTLYQMQSAMVDLAHKEYRDGTIDVGSLIGKLMEAECELKLAVQYLLYEPIRSPEGEIAQIALSELKALRESLGNIRRDKLGKKVKNKRRK